MPVLQKLCPFDGAQESGRKRRSGQCKNAAPGRLETRRAGYDLNEGMAAIYGGKIYYGSDAVVLLSSMTNGRGWAGRFLAVLLRRPARARFLYPYMKVGRHFALKILGKPLI